MSKSPDERICEEATRKLRSTGYAPVSNLACDVQNGVVTIKGSVPTFHLRQVAHSAIQRIDGVREVQDLVEVH
jgi:osmotically-inducible protein OsmY